jgi:hypothetical protein
MINNLVKKGKNLHLLAIIWLFIFSVLRILPHPANVSPLLSLSLFAGSYLNRRMASLFISSILILSDLGLAYFYHYPVIGYWSVFTYSGFLGITLLGQVLHQRQKNVILIYGLTATCSLGYWVWTNLGVWLFYSLYPHTATGLLTCYIAALPFLKSAILGDLFFSTLIFLSYFRVEKMVYQHQAV